MDNLYNRIFPIFDTWRKKGPLTKKPSPLTKFFRIFNLKMQRLNVFGTDL